MTHALGEVTTSSTSSGGSLVASSVVAAACFLWSPPIASGTSGHSARWHPSTNSPNLRVLSPTSSGGASPSGSDGSSLAGSADAPAQDAVAELRRVSGLTWEQIAVVLGVSRRSLHFWASGKPMLPANEERLQRVLSVVRSVDRGSAAKTRRLLLSAGSGSEIALDVLAAARYDDVIALLGRGPGREAVKRVALGEEARARRRPQSVVDRAASGSERSHRDLGEPRRLRVARRK